MIFRETPLRGCLIVDVDRHEDNRGFFARTWCAREFADAGLPGSFVQSSMSRNSVSGTLRGLHFQTPPSREGKLVRCTRGRIFDVVVDIRPASESFLEHFCVELSASNCRALYISPGLAHGFLTLADDTDVMYSMTDSYAPELSAGLRWNDPALGIDWPAPVKVINDRDRKYADVDTAWLKSLQW
jgi:dTDP-4-dehydrorhamnose 3,5-epimerase